MDDIILDATLKKGVSKKGNDYFYISISLSGNVQKKVFLEPAELELMKLTYDI